MRLYHFGELVGILLMIGSVAAQQFYLEPLKRAIEWRLVAFTVQQSGYIETKTSFDTRITILKSLNVPAEQVAKAVSERKTVLEKFKTADANIANQMIGQERVEDLLQILVMVAFAAGTLLTGLGRFAEMWAGRHRGD
jgi:hypothetical protein